LKSKAVCGFGEFHISPKGTDAKEGTKLACFQSQPLILSEILKNHELEIYHFHGSRNHCTRSWFLSSKWYQI